MKEGEVTFFDVIWNASYEIDKLSHIPVMDKISVASHLGLVWENGVIMWNS